ncbi:hypothetical protein [Streptomyces sp. NPDC021224]|uniref:hypothetical protein n=1 Tax=unclassified Streptomyces TaxID=2593676 RepID=UPI0037A96E24
MPRIRTIKPEAFVSESLAEVTVEAERTFVGLLTQADDHGRHRDNAAIIAGLLWPLRAEHTSVHVEDDLTQLAQAGLICRYTGCDGRRYLHVVAWYDHQKIDRPSQSRMPACPHHHADGRCGNCKGVCTRVAGTSVDGRVRFVEGSASEPRDRVQDARTADADSHSPLPHTAPEPSHKPGRSEPTPAPDDAGAARTSLDESSSNVRRAFGEDSASGSRILDPGSSVPSGRDAPDVPPQAGRLVAEYVSACGRRPPNDVVAHVGRVVKKLLGEGIGQDHVRAGLQRYAEIQGHPSRLASLVNDVMNVPGSRAAPGNRLGAPAHHAWTNPADPAAYAEEL